MDAFSHINNVQYFKYFESARINHFYRIGSALIKNKEEISVSGNFDFNGFMHAKKLGPILSKTSCRYKLPAKHPDQFIVCSKIPEDTIGADRFLMKYGVWSCQHARFAAEGEGEIVMYDYENNKKGFVTDELRRALLTVEAEESDYGVGCVVDIL
jgi:acyl-CoA thioester hydrolase